MYKWKFSPADRLLRGCFINILLWESIMLLIGQIITECLLYISSIILLLKEPAHSNRVRKAQNLCTNLMLYHIFNINNALTSEDFAVSIAQNVITEFYLCGADATACGKSTCYNMKKAGYSVTIISDFVTSYDRK